MFKPSIEGIINSIHFVLVTCLDKKENDDTHFIEYIIPFVPFHSVNFDSSNIEDFGGHDNSHMSVAIHNVPTLLGINFRECLAF